MFVVVAAALPLPAQSEGETSTLQPTRLIYLESLPLWDKKAGLTEPSGLALDPSSGDFWIVSDDTSYVLRVNPRATVLEAGPRIKGLSDPEGIALDQSGNRLLVLSESRAEIIVVDPDGLRASGHFPLLDMKGTDMLRQALGDKLERLSPEGIEVDSANGLVLVVNEERPRLLIAISPDLSEIVKVTPLTQERGFTSGRVSERELDSSGLAFDGPRQGLWIASDTGKCVFFLSFRDDLALRFELLWRNEDDVEVVHNAEGLTLNAKGDRLFIVSDDGKKSRLFVYGIE